jgi:hypothetical protein
VLVATARPPRLTEPLLPRLPPAAQRPRLRYGSRSGADQERPVLHTVPRKHEKDEEHGPLHTKPCQADARDAVSVRRGVGVGVAGDNVVNSSNTTYFVHGLEFRHSVRMGLIY